MPATGTTQDPQNSPKGSKSSDDKPDFRGVVDRLLAKRQVDDTEIQEEEQREYIRERYLVLQQDGVPKRIIRQFHEIKRTKPMDKVDEFLDRISEQWCLVLSSTQGLGKSMAAAYWLWKISPDRSAAPGASFRRWWTAAELAAVSAYGDAIPQMKTPGPLVIDDLGVEFLDKNGHFLRVLDDVMDGRYREELPTLITTNLNAETFTERYGERITDRIREGGVFYQLPPGVSMRVKP